MKKLNMSAVSLLVLGMLSSQSARSMNEEKSEDQGQNNITIVFDNSRDISLGDSEKIENSNVRPHIKPKKANPKISFFPLCLECVESEKEKGQMTLSLVKERHSNHVLLSESLLELPPSEILLELPPHVSAKIIKALPERKLYGFLNVLKKNNLETYDEGVAISLFHKMLSNPSIIDPILEKPEYQLTRETLQKKFKNLFSNTVKILRERNSRKDLKNVIKILQKLLPTWLDLTLQNLPLQSSKILADILKNNTTLVSLKLYHTELGDEGIKLLSKALKDNKSLERVELQGANLRSAGIKDFFEVLKNTKNLRVLDLGMNWLDDEACKTLAEILTHNDDIRELNLYDTHVSNKGVMCLWDSLKTKKNFTTFSLRNNRISDKAVSYICKDLKTNNTLTTLDLFGTHFGYEGMKSISEVLQENHSLTNLNIRRQNSKEGNQMLAEALKNNKGLKDLRLGYIDKFILETLKTNASLTAIDLMDHISIEDNETLTLILETLKFNRVRLI